MNIFSIVSKAQIKASLELGRKGFERDRAIIERCKRFNGIRRCLSDLDYHFRISDRVKFELKEDEATLSTNPNLSQGKFREMLLWIGPTNKYFGRFEVVDACSSCSRHSFFSEQAAVKFFIKKLLIHTDLRKKE